MIDLHEQVEQRLDPSALHIKRITVEGFKALRTFDVEFDHHNIIVGMNGVGKTTLLHLMAGIAGNTDATDLVMGEKIGRIEMVLGSGNEEFRFEAKDTLDPEVINAFKSTLPEGKRVNYGLSEYYYEKFQSGCCDYATFEESLRFFFDRLGEEPRLFSTQGNRSSIDPGSGITQAIRLLYLSSMRGGPLLIDHPETSLDYRNNRLLSMMLLSGHKQTIVVTHSLEWGVGRQFNKEKIIEISAG